MQVVRYHSLVIDADTLPEDILPIAWTTSNEALPLSDDRNTDMSKRMNDHAMQKHFDDDLLMGRYSSTPLNKPRKVIMGVRHSTRPHYGVQVSAGLCFSIAACRFCYILNPFQYAVSSRECGNMLWSTDI